ncbi:MAG: hypothetical protein IPO62_14665 [Saprospiraceae bacterium]|nr:hypothetical protein [Saprospiraceae bacterium]
MKKDGSLWGCGKNQYGQLGIGTNTINTTYNWTKILQKLVG